MFGSAFIVFRETVEAALIIGILAAAKHGLTLRNAWLLDNAFVPGRFLHALIDYEAMPSGIQVAFYTATLILVLASMQFFRVRPPSSLTY